MKQMTFYVNTVAAGDMHILASSGFELVPIPKTVSYPTQVREVKVQDGRRSGELKLSFAVVRSAWEYEYEIADTVDQETVPVWQETRRTSNSRLNYIDDLQPGQRYYIHVRARNGKGVGDWSETVSFIVR